MTNSSSDKEDSQQFLETLIGSALGKPALYQRALTHGSIGNLDDYQRLEFLGDRVLGLAIASWLYNRLPNAEEGELSQRLNRLVSRDRCAQVARQWSIGPYIKLGKQASDDGGRESTNILGDVVEALIGACYLDHGMEAAAAMVERLWGDELADDNGPTKHPKSALQEWTAGSRRKPPEYRLVERTGPDHAARFIVEVSVHNVGAAQAQGASKQEAETAAAAAFMERYG